MILYHTSPVEIKEIDNGITRPFGTTFCFSDEPYFMGSHASSIIYSIEVDEDDFIDEASFYDADSLIDDIASYLSISLEEAEEVATGEVSSFYYNANDDEDWHIQRMKAEYARESGYIGCISEDEQGAVYLIDMNTDLLDKMQIESD